MTLRDRGCKIIVQMWKPFHYLLARFQSRINLKTSLVDTFATLLLLSYVKIGFGTFYVLSPTRLWSPDGSYVWVVYLNPSLKYFGPSHAGYAIVALLFAFTVLLLPVIILLLYPCLCFQRCLNRFHLRSLALLCSTSACASLTVSYGIFIYTRSNYSCFLSICCFGFIYTSLCNHSTIQRCSVQ